MSYYRAIESQDTSFEIDAENFRDRGQPYFH